MNTLKIEEKLAAKYKYKKLPDDLSEKYRNFWKNNIPDFLSISGDRIPLYTIYGSPICEWYDRIVIGDYGAFIEFPKSAICNDFEVAKGQEYRIYDERYSTRVKYHWLTISDGSDIKIYKQIRGVTYADYQPNKYYISVHEAFNMESVADVIIAKQKYGGNQMIKDIIIPKRLAIYNSDCIKIMKELPPNSFDLICADIPYGTTACKWDKVIDFDLMWKELNRLAKNEGTPILLFGQQPFTSELIHSNIKNFKYIWYYKKLIASNFASAKYQPMKHIEEICVFTKNGKTPNYYPIMQERAESGKNRISAGYKHNSETPNETMGNIKRNNTDVKYNLKLKYPENVQVFNNREKGARGLHPTQKPLSLIDYLIKTHSKEDDLVLDFTMGSGTTGVSCIKNNRKFVGIEIDEKYYEIAKNRIKNEVNK